MMMIGRSLHDWYPSCSESKRRVLAQPCRAVLCYPMQFVRLRLVSVVGIAGTGRHR